nr:hypothetical protein [Streptomyces pseudovenezuelae]
MADRKPVENVGDRLHGFGHISVAEVLFGGHQFDAELLKLSFGYGGVDVVPEDARSHVDDDAIYVTLFYDALNHLAKYWALGDRLCGVSGLDVLIDYVNSQLSGFLFRMLSLRVDRVTFGVEVGVRVHLAFGRNTQVQNCSFHSTFLAMLAQCLRWHLFSFLALLVF